MSDPPTLPPGEQLTARIRKSFGGERRSSSPSTSIWRWRVASQFCLEPRERERRHCSTALPDCKRLKKGTLRIGTTVLFDSQSRLNLPPSRRSVAYLLQSLALFPHMTVEQNVQYGLGSLSKNDRDARSGEVLESFRISPLLKRRASEISAGERQRVALARALVTRPRALLLDEPLTALDVVTKARILDDLRAWNRRHRIPILYVTHDREEVFALGESALVLDDGHIIAQGSPHEVMRRPAIGNGCATCRL